MSTYVMSDLHGYYFEYCNMLQKINFSDDDKLYIIGDVLDRGPYPISIVLDIMDRPNVVCLAGNHEHMAMECLPTLMKEITQESVQELNEDIVEALLDWQYNGSTTTMSEFQCLNAEQRKSVIEYLGNLDLYDEIQVNDQKYLLVHAGLGNYSPDKELDEYEMHELLWERADYDTQYFEDKIVISGHTPTCFIEGNDKPGYIFKKNNHIAIDCGVGIEGGHMGCICLETLEEFYI